MLTNAIIQVRDVEIPEDEILIDIVPDKFVLEDGSIIEDPIEKLSTSFTLNAQIILAKREYVKN